MLLERNGFGRVRTYIQSGNVVFQSPKGTSSSIAKRVRSMVLKDYGLNPRVFVLSVQDFMSAAANNPFPEADADPKALHVFFLAEIPQSPDLESLSRLQTGKEAFALRGKVFYLHTPDGFSVSKVRARVERCLGVDATARNWRTVNKLLEMVREPV